MHTVKTRKWNDILERSFWTALESTFGILLVDNWVVIPEGVSLQVVLVTTGLAFLRNVGKYRTALWTS